MNYQPSLKIDKVWEPVLDRLERLIEQSSNPQATMEELEAMLQEEGLVVELPTDEAMAFSLNLMEVVKITDSDAYRIPQGPMRNYETAEGLVTAMMVSSRD
jgi:molecular chaperone GrpE (heat shock protein)